MKTKLTIIFGILIFSAASIFAQNGGKAEANRIKFAKGKLSATVAGKIKGDEQAEYAFAAIEGQTVTIKIASIPKGKYTSFKVLNDADEPEFTSESDANYDYTFTAPYSGDYLIWVNLRPAGNVKSARFNLTLSIK